MKTIEELAEMIRSLPGIGPRHAKRIAYALLSGDRSIPTRLGKILLSLEKGTRQCPECRVTFFSEDNIEDDQCAICLNKKRDGSMLLIVANDIDRDAIEKSRLYDGYYLIIGKLLPLGERNAESLLPKDAIRNIVKERQKRKLSEIILGFNATPDAEHTADVIQAFIKKEFPELVVSRLGRGLSTGTELEYSDGETLRYALSRREK